MESSIQDIAQIGLQNLREGFVKEVNENMEELAITCASI
jgi:hypothetical protein